MGFIDKLKGELIDIIEWTQPDDSDILAFRFPRYQNEIKMGAKLTVREGQAAVFVNEGKITDVFTPGMYELQTNNLPVLSTLRGWKYGFNSPFKAEVYFVATAQQTDRKWGTANPLMMRDPDFGMVRVRAFGSYVFRVTDPGLFITDLVATDPTFEDFEIDSQLRNVIVSKFADVIGKANIPVLDLVGNYQELSDFVKRAITEDFSTWGVEVLKFYVENISLPPEVEAAIDRRSAMGAVGDLSKYTQFQTAEAIKAASENPSGGAAGAGVGLGAGLAMAQHMMGAATAPQASQGLQPPPLPNQTKVFHAAIDGQSQGPLDMNTIAQLINQNKIQRETLVWCAGMANWEEAGSVSELQGLFAATPPPLPK